jgi:branched-chain amino acid aminotransferase
MRAAKEKRLLEAFGAGTAAVVSPIKALNFEGTEIEVPIDPVAGAGPLTRRFWDEFTAIQYGHKEHPWSVRL